MPSAAGPSTTEQFPTAAGAAPGRLGAAPMADVAVHAGDVPMPDRTPVVRADAQPMPSAEPETIEQVDAALAREVDALLDGEFESVDDVLDGIFSEQTEKLRGDRTAEADSRTAAGEHHGSVGDDSPPHPESHIIPSAPGSIPKPIAEYSTAASATSEATLPAQGAAPGIPPAQAASSNTSRQGLWRQLVRLVAATLAVVNLPMRLVPEPYRPIADWVALSLVFWIPIAWVLALFLVGR
jgi:hypothetical protein